MNSDMSFYAVQTKITARKGNILKNLNRDNVLECSTIEQLKSLLLKNKEFIKIFSEVRSDNINRDSFEAILSRLPTIETEDLLHYLSGYYKEFIKELLAESEIKDISLILRKIARHDSLEGIESRFIHSDKYATLNFVKLLSSKNARQFIENLKGSSYYEVLKNLTEEDVVKREFHIEMKLYVELYKNLMEKAERLDRKDKEAVKNIVGFKIDLLNVQWICRALNYYKISTEEVLFYCLLGGKSLDYKQLKKLSYSKSYDEFINLVKSYTKIDLFGEINQTGILNINNYLYDYINKVKFKNIGTVISYIYLINIITDDITTIVEGIKYNVPKEKIRDYLSCRKQKGREK